MFDNRQQRPEREPQPAVVTLTEVRAACAQAVADFPQFGGVLDDPSNGVVRERYLDAFAAYFYALACGDFTSKSAREVAAAAHAFAAEFDVAVLLQATAGIRPAVTN